MRLNRTPRPAALAFILALAVGSGGARRELGGLVLLEVLEDPRGGLGHLSPKVIAVRAQAGAGERACLGF